MLVFSSVLSTKSFLPKGLPPQRPSYRSRTRPAFSANCGSRGKIQLRYLQGRSASSLSQRQMVVCPMEATRPRRTISRWMSGTWKRERGSPVSRGIWHARALTLTTTLGGKKPGAAPTGEIVKTVEALLGESLPPLAYDLSRDVDPRGDLLVLQSLRRVENDLGPHDVAIR